MVPAQGLYSLFPRTILGSHCSINRLAYGALQKLQPHLKLPKLYRVNHHEGLNGVDGLWLHNKLLPSHSTYNPITGQGNGLKELAYQFNALLRAIQLRRRGRIARRMAFVSHVITDICTPPHQHGKLIDLRHKRWYWFWHIRDDWHERYGERYFVDHHLFFEYWALWSVWREKLPPIQIDQTWLQQPLDHPTDQVTHYVQETVRMIRSYNLYPEYVESGWTPAIHRQFVDVVFPQIATTVATVWYLAFAVAKTA